MESDDAMDMIEADVRIGDIIEILLSDGKRAYGQFVFVDKMMGYLLQVFDLITEHDIDLNLLEKAKPMFPPVITGLRAAVRTGLWKVIGNLPVRDFVYPGFISTLWNQKTGEARIWFLWDGEQSIRLGKSLSSRHKKLEYLVVWSPYDVVERIETGEYPYPYRDLINFNKFQPMES